ncbi:hypothetical protein NMY22_g10132 [Coprinellus aureogranulatus]|nr:hypothetical protein NMY22_g10132 [Coprinellus aureogranulatus]
MCSTGTHTPMDLSPAQTQMNNATACWHKKFEALSVSLAPIPEDTQVPMDEEYPQPAPSPDMSERKDQAMDLAEQLTSEHERLLDAAIGFGYGFGEALGIAPFDPRSIEVPYEVGILHTLGRAGNPGITRDEFRQIMRRCSECSNEDRSAKIMRWFLRRWDRISRGLFEVPRRLREELEEALQLPMEENGDTASLGDDAGASSTYTYSKGSLGSTEVGEKREELRAKAFPVQAFDRPSDDAERWTGAPVASRSRHSNTTSPSTASYSLPLRQSPRQAHQAPTVDDSEDLCPRTNRNSVPHTAGRLSTSKSSTPFLLESTSKQFDDREVAESPMEYDERERLDHGSSCVPLSLLGSEVLQVTGTGEEMDLHERTGTEGTLESVGADERVLLLPEVTVSVDEMLDEMISKSYELVSEGTSRSPTIKALPSPYVLINSEPVPPSTHGEKTILSSEALLPSNSSANVALIEAPSHVRPLHLKPKYKAQSLLNELRREMLEAARGRVQGHRHRHRHRHKKGARLSGID